MNRIFHREFNRRVWNVAAVYHLSWNSKRHVWQRIWGTWHLDRGKHNSQRETEMSEDRQLRLHNSCIRHNNCRWSKKTYSAMNYYHSILDYRPDPAIFIVSPSVCQYCLGLRWKDASKGIYCSDAKIKLNDIIVPPDPSLLDRSHPKHTEITRNSVGIISEGVTQMPAGSWARLYANI